MNGRSLKQNIEIINERVRLINKKLGTKFYASYGYSLEGLDDVRD